MSALEQRFEAFWEAMGSGDFEAAAGLYALDTHVDLSGLKLEGRDALREHMESFRRGFPDVVYTVHRRETIGEDLVVEEWSCTATHGGEFVGQPPSGARIRLRAATVYELEGEHVARERSYMDMSSTMVKIGALKRADT